MPLECPHRNDLPTLLAQRCPFSAQLPYLLLYAGTYLRKGEAKFLGADPANRCAFDDERVAFSLWEDATLQFGSDGDCHGTRDATASRGEVSQLALTGPSDSSLKSGCEIGLKRGYADVCPSCAP